MIDKDTKELERALNPMKWDKELNDTWHKNIPDLQKAFDAIKDIVIKRAEVKMKYEIEIEGLPEGWEPVCYRPPNEGEYYLQNGVVYSSIDMTYPRIIVRKEQPRRIVLEETDEDNQTGCGELMDQILCCHDDILIRLSKPKKYWRIVEDNGEKNGD